jgi:hypothetical protein
MGETSTRKGSSQTMGLGRGKDRRHDDANTIDKTSMKERTEVIKTLERSGPREMEKPSQSKKEKCALGVVGFGIKDLVLIPLLVLTSCVVHRPL